MFTIKEKSVIYLFNPDEMQCALASLNPSKPIKKKLFPETVDILQKTNQCLNKYQKGQNKSDKK